MVKDEVKELGQFDEIVKVSLSNELVQLLSDQLYSSPLKAIEELVVNSYDADAKQCILYVPSLSDGLFADKRVIVYDDGHGMDAKGLHDLWRIGRSTKTGKRSENKAARKMIGKFGIGKLATYSISNQITYFSKADDGVIRSVSLNYDDFESNPTGVGVPVELPMLVIDDDEKFYSSDSLKIISNNLEIDIHTGFRNKDTWTIVILENLKQKTLDLQLGRLKWVLATAMPITKDFTLFLGSTEVQSSKSQIPRVVEFKITDIPQSRIDKLNKKSKQNWKFKDDKLLSDLFKDGITAEVFITEKPISEGKSSDLSRSNGFFVRVRERLVNLIDKDFGLSLSSAETSARFRAEVYADDLDKVITAPREGVESSDLKERFQEVLEVIYLHARGLYEEYKVKKNKEFERNKEGNRQHVFPELVEKPIADVISIDNNKEDGTEADDSWFYFEKPNFADSRKIALRLYDSPRRKYKYSYQGFGRSNRLVKYDPKSSEFEINSDHDLVAAYSDDARSRTLLEDLVTAEALLEVYLREQNLSPVIIGEVLEKRDKLFRGLAKDHKYSPNIISADIRDSASNDLDLEINQVIAVRALGFQAVHKAGAGEPDGVVRFNDVNSVEQVITLEAKSSTHTPQLSQLDFAGLKEHMDNHKASGCLLLAPSYPGESKENLSSASARANELKISCWTIDNFCKLLEARDSRHITADDVFQIVTNSFTPTDVNDAINSLLSGPNWEIRKLYNVIVETLKKLENKLPGSSKNISQIAAVITYTNAEFGDITVDNVRKAVREIAGSSKGALIVKDDIIQLNASIDELERRISNLTGNPGLPFENSNFKE